MSRLIDSPNITSPSFSPSREITSCRCLKSSSLVRVTVTDAGCIWNTRSQYSISSGCVLSDGSTRIPATVPATLYLNVGQQRQVIRGRARSVRLHDVAADDAVAPRLRHEHVVEAHLRADRGEREAWLVG